MKLKYFAILAAFASIVSVNAQMTENAVAENGRYKGQTTGIYYDINSDNVSVRTAQMEANTDNPSNVTYIDNNPHYSLSGSLTIPDYVNINNKQYPVTEIGNFSFSFNWGFTDVKLPATITRIGVGAFMRSGNITSIEIKNNCIVDKYALAGTGISTFNMDFINSISEGTFFECRSLNNVDLSAVTYIGEKAFESCNLSSINILGPVSKIGDNAFKSCNSLKDVTIGKVGELGDRIFEGSSLENVTIEGPVSIINTNTFKGVNNFKNLVIGDVNTIAEGAFELVKLQTLKFTGSVEYIGAKAFRETSISGDLELSNIKYIGAQAFANNNSLTGAVKLKNIDYIGEYCFSPTQIKSVDIENVKEIGPYAFYNTTQLDGLIKIRDVETLGEYCFEKSQVSTVDIDNIDVIGQYSFYDTSNLTKVIIGDHVRVIDVAAFAGGISEDPNNRHNVSQLKDFETISLGMRIEIIDDYAFYRRAFKCLVIPDACWKIGDYAFCGGKSGYDKTQGCGLQLGRGVRSVGKYAFYQCHIFDLTIPENLEFVGDSAFDFIEAEGDFNDIYFYDPEPDCNAFSDNAFADWMYKTVTIHVPEGCLDNYKNCKAFQKFWGPRNDGAGSSGEEGSLPGDDDLQSAQTTLSRVLGYAFLVPTEEFDLNSDEFTSQIGGIEIDGKKVEWEKWIYDPYDEDKYELVAELEKDENGEYTGSGKGVAKNYGQAIVYAVRKAQRTVFDQNCDPVPDTYQQIVGCAVLFVCPTYTVAYDNNDATADLNDGTTRQNIRAKESGVNGEENTGDVVTGTVTDVKTANSTYQHLVVYNSYPKLLVEPVAGITISQVDRAKVDVDQNFTDDGAWKTLEDETGENPQLLEIQDDQTTTNKNAKFIVPLNPVVEDRVIVLTNAMAEKYVTTDVETVEVGNNISVTVNRFTITINGADDKDVVTVTNMNGQTVYTGLSKTLTMKSQGVYIITVGDTAFKALVR